MTLRSTLRVGLGALVVSVSLALVVPPAHAAPPPTPGPAAAARPLPVGGSSGTTHFDFTTTGTTAEKALRAALVMKNSKDRKKRHLDWRAAKKYFGEHTTWRDDFAAGYVGAGGTLDHAATSTKTRLKKRYNDKMSSLARIALSPQQRGGTNCTGTTKDVEYSRSTGRSETWLNSCDTNTLIAQWSSCSLALGWVTGRVKGWYSAIPGFFAMICGQKAAALGVAKSNSSVGAIKYYYTRVARVGGNGMVDGQLRIEATLYSQ